MSERLAAAQAALQAGRGAEAAEHLSALAAESPDQPLGVYHTLAMQLYRLGRHAEAERWAAEGLTRHPKAVDLMNLRGVLLRRLGRQKDAIEVLNGALRLSPKNTAALANLGNVLLDDENPAAAEQVFSRLIRMEPKVAEHQRLYGRALSKLSKHEAALARFRQAILLDRKNQNAWADLVGQLMQLGRNDEALEALGRATALFPNDVKLREGQVLILKQQSRPAEAEARLRDALAADDRQAWAHHQLAWLLADTDRESANAHMRRAHELEPGNLEYLFSLAESLQRSRHGDEAAYIQEAYELLAKVPLQQNLSPKQRKSAGELFLRVGDYERYRQLGSMTDLARIYAGALIHPGLMNLIPRVRTAEDRRELVAAHRLWGERIEAVARQTPVRTAPSVGSRAKLRVGFMSSDLRRHPVGSFALPLFQAYDRDRFEVYGYSWSQRAQDDVQRYIAGAIEGFRWRPDVSDRDAAQLIADDQLDILIELGGSTHMNKLEVMAWKPAPIQASWLGYAHSPGPSTIDYLVLDPFMRPEDPALLIERPLMLPHCWYSLSGEVYSDAQELAETAPVERNGYVTFGTANNPYKYGPELLASWARILARTPNSRFLFVRPEGGSAAFRQHMLAPFLAAGVEEERILFEPVRGRHMPFYNQMDMSLDAWPQTGGTTTCESLWMGAPVVSLVGEALYERLSWSVLSNLGLQELCATTVQGYEDVAVALASDPAGIGELRRTLRQRMRASPMGDPNQWARDFFDAVAATVEGHKA